MSHTFSEGELQVLCREWQAELSLRDWDVRVSVVRAREMAAEDRQGECLWLLAKRQAIIHLIDPVDYAPDIPWPQDQEVTLVHELLHLHGAPLGIEAGTPADVALEQAIHATAQALVRLKRAARAAGAA